MKQTILVIGRNFHPDGKETAKLIADSLAPFVKQHGFSVDFLHFKDIIFDISPSNGVVVANSQGAELKEYAAVFMTNWFSHASIRKDIAHSLALYFRHNDVPFFNEEAAITRSTSKLSQLVTATYNKVPVARTIFSLSLDHATNKAEQVIQAPFILKDAQASRGHANYLLQDFAAVQAHSAQHTERHPFIFQQFIHSDGSDYRFFTVAGSSVVIKRSGAKGSHLNNTSAGGSAELVPYDSFDDEVKRIVTTMSRVLNRSLTGIDIMFDATNGKPYFLEANPIPQIATGSFINEKLALLSAALVQSVKEGK